MANLRLARVNREIAKRWKGVEMVKGPGYFYLIGNHALDSAFSTSIYVYGLNHLTLEQWMARIESVLADAYKGEKI